VWRYALADAVLDAFERLERRHARRAFRVDEIVAHTLAGDSQFKESTVRTHVISRMCAIAPDHHAVTYDDLDSRGAWTLRSSLSVIRRRTGAELVRSAAPGRTGLSGAQNRSTLTTMIRTPDAHHSPSIKDGTTSETEYRSSCVICRMEARTGLPIGRGFPSTINMKLPKDLLRDRRE